MKRFFGMMPSDEIDIEKRYTDKNGYKITIQAGLHGWTILWSDMSSNFKDSDATAEENFKTAYDTATNAVGSLSEVGEPAYPGEC
jgi:hypothetical protein